MDLLTIQETAARLKVKDATVRRWIRSGVLRGAKLGRVYRIEEGSLADLLSAARVVPEAPAARQRRRTPLPNSSGFVHLPRKT